MKIADCPYCGKKIVELQLAYCTQGSIGDQTFFKCPACMQVFSLDCNGKNPKCSDVPELPESE